MAEKTKKTAAQFRTYPHANSGRKLADRFDEDRREAEEYTATPIRNRKGGIGNYPNLYDDNYTAMSDKYPVKPKRRRDNETIRRGGLLAEDAIAADDDNPNGWDLEGYVAIDE